MQGEQRAQGSTRTPQIQDKNGIHVLGCELDVTFRQAYFSTTEVSVVRKTVIRGGYPMILQKCIAVIFLLFSICFTAIAIEETFLGGRRRRKLERELRERRVRDQG